MPPRTRPRDRAPTRVGTPESEAAETTARESGGNWERASLETNQKGIQEVCETLANKMDLLTQRTQALEKQVDQLNEAVEKHTREIDELKAKSKKGTERLESLENNARRNNIKLMNVPEGSEGEDIKAFVVDLLKQSEAWQGSVEVLSRDIQRVHRDPFRKPPNRIKPRRI
ncbi:hypothetical protein NDU88_002750 [Pleurodeles waltl]|uniref:Uncharacterized protein n=1 Tax=Pleurodeles waltl TaxID=8319 RepID=A0AAV7P968_PLEWA|nr:hypothetical protein NDU88_002750 [Pleurodeles waltl]